MATTVLARAPGRVNLIGEHTDYNDGFVLPMALPFETTIRAVRRQDDRIRLDSVGYESLHFEVGADPRNVAGWGRYVAGMVHLMQASGMNVPGFDAQVSTTIPVGASLSSSAALEVAAGMFITALAGEQPDRVWIATLGQQVENEIIGINSGIMDQLISAVAAEGGASLIDCRDLSFSSVRVPSGASVVIMDTTTRRELVDSEYDLRRASCERAARDIGVVALRDASSDDVRRVASPVDRRRAAHVVAENQRVLDVVAAFEADELAHVGEIMIESHRSLRDDYEVSAPALDAMVAVATTHGGCFGARMTGGGFAGCAVALVDTGAVEQFCTHVADGYAERTGLSAELWPVSPAPGASIETID